LAKLAAQVLMIGSRKASDECLTRLLFMPDRC
jgi:hypothetical protein